MARVPLSPFMMTQILEPTHLSMSSRIRSEGENHCACHRGHEPRGRSCEAILKSLAVCGFVADYVERLWRWSRVLVVVRKKGCPLPEL
jgi:hypothetical protein